VVEQSTVIAESLAGKRIAVTGSTGFVGTALIERLMRSVPDCEVILLVRDGKRTPAARRTSREILKNDAFDRLREAHGSDFGSAMASRITTVAGDVTRDDLGLSEADQETFVSCDVIIHSAAAVSFDSPSTRPSRSTCSARPALPTFATNTTSPPTSLQFQPATSPATGEVTHQRLW